MRNMFISDFKKSGSVLSDRYAIEKKTKVISKISKTRPIMDNSENM